MGRNRRTTETNNLAGPLVCRVSYKVAGRSAPSACDAYAATKSGLNGWSESLRQERDANVLCALPRSRWGV